MCSICYILHIKLYEHTKGTSWSRSGQSSVVGLVFSLESLHSRYSAQSQSQILIRIRVTVY